MKNVVLSSALFVLLVSATIVKAGEPKASIPYDPPPAPRPSLFERGRFEFSSVWQTYWSFDFGNERPTLDYLLGGHRLGYMLSSPNGVGPWRANNELLLEGFYSSIQKGPGDWIAGGNIILRRNFIGQDERWVWYVQLGAGVVGNDVYKDQTQTLIGRWAEISLLGGIGLRYQINGRWSLSAEVNYRHFSNADTAERNTGLDSLGGGVGLGYSF